MAGPRAATTMTGPDDRLRALKKAHGAATTGPTPRVEDYVEVIYELILEKGAAQVVDISAHLSVSAPTASKMIQKLADDGLVIYERYRAIALTPAGTELAKRVRQRHDIVMDFLRLIGVEESAAHRATEGIEHHLEPGTLERLARLVAYAKAHPEWWREHDQR
jgi:Mn-dependent DtxR family transcriptional regulator